jgi:transporter family protein
MARADKPSLLQEAALAVIFGGERPVVRDWAGNLLLGAGVFVPGLER